MHVQGWSSDPCSVHFSVAQVSQFTLYALAKGNKPDYHLAMPPDKVTTWQRCTVQGVEHCMLQPAPNTDSATQAKHFYGSFVERLRREYQPERVKDGVFGAMMDVALVNDVRTSTFKHSPGRT